MPDLPILGAVLAGGQSRRFGSDKATALLGGKPLIDHAIDALRPIVHDVIVVGGSREGLSSIADRPAIGAGPLGGLCAAIYHASLHGYAGVLTTGCDVPVFPQDLANALIGPTPAIVRGHQIVGWWPAGLLQQLDDWLAEQSDHAVIAFARAAGARIVEAGAELPNVNRREDLDRLS
jgi:molybdenum cofactor guanylyltransferase